MCGIAGLYLKTPDLEPELGRLTALMLHENVDPRAGFSAGFAIYGNANGIAKVSTLSRTGETNWKHLEHELEHVLGSDVKVETLFGPRHLFKTSGERPNRAQLADRERPRCLGAGGRFVDRTVARASATRMRWPTRLGLAGTQRHPCGGPYKDGDRERGQRPRARTRSRPGPIPAWCITARCRTTTACART